MRTDLPLRFGHGSQLLLEVADLVAQARRKLELELFGGRVHLVGKLADQIGQILRGQPRLEDLLVPAISLLRTDRGNAQM